MYLKNLNRYYIMNTCNLPGNVMMMCPDGTINKWCDMSGLTCPSNNEQDEYNNFENNEYNRFNTFFNIHENEKYINPQNNGQNVIKLNNNQALNSQNMNIINNDQMVNINEPKVPNNKYITGSINNVHKKKNMQNLLLIIIFVIFICLFLIMSNIIVYLVTKKYFS